MSPSREPEESEGEGRIARFLDRFDDWLRDNEGVIYGVVGAMVIFAFAYLVLAVMTKP